MNKILWYLTNKYDASLTPLPLFLLLKGCTEFISCSDVMSMCTTKNQSGDSKGGESEVQSRLLLF